MNLDKGYWVIRTYTAGEVGEKTKFYVPEAKGRNRKKEAASIRKQEQNESNATRLFARLINTNFGHADYLLGLDFSDAGIERVKKTAERIKAKKERDDYTDEDYIRLAAGHEAYLMIRRLKNKLPKHQELKYLIVASDREKNKRTGDFEPCRVHCHIVISACCSEITEVKEKIIKAWQLGGMYLEHLYDSPDYWGLAEYLMEQVRRIPDAKKYKPSRNLALDKPKDRIVYSEAELRLPKHATFLRRGEHKAGEPQYLRYLLPKKKHEEEKTTYEQI